MTLPCVDITILTWALYTSSSTPNGQWVYVMNVILRGEIPYRSPMVYA